MNDPSLQVSKQTKLQIIKMFAQISSSRQSLFTLENQRSLFKRLNFLGLAVHTETSDLFSKDVQLEIIFYMKRVFYIYGELVFKYNKTFGEIIWRSIARIILYVLAKNAVFFDVDVIHKIWAFLNTLKRRKYEKYLNLNSSHEANIPINNINTNHYLYSGKLIIAQNFNRFRHDSSQPRNVYFKILSGSCGIFVQSRISELW
jgi:hypothetical protein